MKATKKRELKIAFVVDEDDLKRLDQLLEGVGGPRRYTVQLADGTTLEDDLVESILTIPNSSKRAIREIAVETRGETPVHAEVTVTARWGFETIEYKLRGEDRAIQHPSSQLDEWVSSVRPWYSWIATANLFNLIVTTVLWIAGLGLAVLIITGLVRGVAFDELTQPTATSSILSGFALGNVLWAIVFILGFLGNFFRDRLFPVASFAIGAGVKRHQRLTVVRNGLAFTFPLSIVASVIVTWIMGR